MTDLGLGSMAFFFSQAPVSQCMHVVQKNEYAINDSLKVTELHM